MSRHGIFVLFVLISISVHVRVNGKAVSNEDDYLDELLKEFQETRSKTLKKVPKSEDDENIIALNAQYLKHDGCNCTKFFMCDVGSKKLNSHDGSSEEEGADLDLINIRLNVPQGGCPHFLDICCEKIREQRPLLVPTPQPVKPVKPTCGKRNDRGVGFRIVGGKDNESQFGEFPWMTAIIELKQPKHQGGKVLKSFICGASLIHQSVVLTASHCLRNKTADTLLIRVGEWDTQTTSELYPYEEVLVDQIIMHPNFVMKKTILNDIALLILKKPVQLAPNVAPICLPSSSVTTDFDGERCFATGWGKDVFGAQGVYHSILKRVELPIIPRRDCQERLRGTKLGSKFHLHESFICAGGEIAKDTCKGDGGSPLFCKVSGSSHYVQLGIVSWGIGCGNAIPGVYVNVPHFSPWIEQVLESLDLGDDKNAFSKPI
ncbi:phenoloxidase-activating factor 2 isoform X2 [Folsomia candida]|nr:phenoloxidase-activating factor 2 isoform X2 [Folsomia candida]